MSSDRAIVHVLPAGPWGGVQAIVPMLAAEQVRQGRRVSILCLGSDHSIDAAIDRHGLSDVTRTLAGRLAPLRLLRLVVGLRDAIVHTHCEPEWAGLAVALGGVRRWVRHVHVYPEGGASRITRVGRWLARRVARHIAVSPSVARALTDSDLARRDDVDVVPNGIAGDAALPPRPPGAPFTIGFIGRVVPEKGIFDFLGLAARLHDIDARFAVFGDGGALPVARERAAALGLADRVAFHGHVEDIAAAWSTLDIATVFSAREPFGLVFLEAALRGVSTITWENGSGGSEVAATLRSAHRVAPGDLAAAAAIVRRLANDRAADAEALAEDRATVLGRYDVATMARGVAAAYARLDEPGRAR